MSGNDIGLWFRSIPDITRYWFAGSIIFPLAGRFGILNYFDMILDYAFISRFQIWRPFTCLLYYPITPATGFHYLIMLYFLYSYSSRLESGLFAGKPADYLFLVIFNWLALIVVCLFLGFPLLFDPMVMSILYIWCQLNRDNIVSFWFGTQFKAMYLPWVLLAFNLIIRGGGFSELLGILVGHLYFFLMFKYPQDFGGRTLIGTPSFFYNFLPNHRGVMSGFGSAPPTRQPAARADQQGGAHRWGQGNVLGGQ
ncbi:DERL1 [Bugula neritina]|uniref:Derlin n=1 Tax=Bugula neritina TaxID=10212 RepID=A0A7J7JHZ4_BUGNE|nr:DERL1 [Bugula neritina]